METKKLIKDKKGIFGLNAVQAFFAIILAIGLLAYVIVIIMGTLQDADILTMGTQSIYEEIGAINTTGNTFTRSTVDGFSSVVILSARNRTAAGSAGLTITAANYTVTATNTVVNTSVAWNNVSFNYSYNYNTIQMINQRDLLSNTSNGITSFFTSMSPVYAILAVLVIILILVVLVRVVTGGTGNRSEGSVDL